MEFDVRMISFGRWFIAAIRASVLFKFLPFMCASEFAKLRNIISVLMCRFKTS